jgi:hypothetical protein
MKEPTISQPIFDQIKAAIDHAENTEQELGSQKLRNSHL